MRVIRTATGAMTINPKLLTCAESLQYRWDFRRKQTNAAIMALVGNAAPLNRLSVQQEVRVAHTPRSPHARNACC